MKKIALLIAALFVAFSSCFAQSGFHVGIDLNGGIGFEQPVRMTKPQASANLVGGYQFNPFLFLGIGMGIGHFCPLYEDRAKYPGSRIEIECEYQTRNLFQLFIREKVNFLDRKVSPFTSLDIGYPMGRRAKETSRLFIEPAIGCDFQIGKTHSVNIMVGYRMQGVSYTQSRYNDYDQLISVAMEKISGQLTLHMGFVF